MLNLKRVLDILISSAVLLVLMPLLVAVAITILMIDGRPIFFMQERPGLNREIFNMIKFRTMKNLQDDVVQEDKVRISKLGIFLRSFSIDEIPELFNVLLGHMSLVGPRPLLIEYLELYSDLQNRRHEVKPGVTGWAQINGRNALEWEEKFKLDVWYVENQSILLDLKILFKTVFSVISRKNISFDGEATMKKFNGNRE